MAIVNRTGLVEAEPGEQERHVHQRPEEGRDPGQEAEDQTDPDSHLAEGDQPREPGLVVPGDQEVDEVAIPLVGDRRATLARVGDLRRGLPEAGERAAAVDPAATGELVPAGLEPGEADEQADRQPEESRLGVGEQEAREPRAFDLGNLGARVLARLEEHDEQRDERDPEPDRHDLAERALVDVDPRVEQQDEQCCRDDPERDPQATDRVHRIASLSMSGLGGPGPSGLPRRVCTSGVVRSIWRCGP